VPTVASPCRRVARRVRTHWTAASKDASDDEYEEDASDDEDDEDASDDEDEEDASDME
jgi:hypothetical protein